MQKQQLREQAKAARKAQADKDAVSQIIIERVVRLPEYLASTTLLWYVDVRDEVRTRPALPGVIASDKTIAVPYCVENELELFRLESMDDLRPGKFGILEPPRGLRRQADRKVTVDTIDLAIVPGIAFDPAGGRLGHGKGYYDRLLSGIPESAIKVGVAFDCQIYASVPTDAHDIAMDIVVTQSRVQRPN